MKAKSQIIIAENYGIIDHENGVIRASVMSIDLMSMLRDREIGKTPEGEASTSDLFNAWYKGWDKARQEEMRKKFPEMYK